MAFFREDDHTLHYLERGRGEPLLLIHGLGSCGADWAFQVAVLEKKFRLIIPDLPGSGHSPPPLNEYAIRNFAVGLWKLIDHLKIDRTSIVGFSLGGAVALEMATLRPACVPKLGLINSLATYRADHWTKWVETHVAATVVRVLGMRRAANLAAGRLFPEPWQRKIRDHMAAAMSTVPASNYLGMGLALASWAAVDRLDRLVSDTLIIAAENDLTPLEEKRALAKTLDAALIVVRGSRHGTPFDSIEVTNAALLAHLTGQPLPPQSIWTRDPPALTQALSLAGSIAEEHALSATSHARC